MPEFGRSSNLIFDLGMNNGDDTAHYLRTGAVVVAVEANAALVAQARERFATEVREGRVILVHAAIADRDGTAIFHVNLDNDHWSSLDPGWAGREGSDTRSVTVPALTLGTLVARYGLPRYLKIDVEGADQMVLDQLKALSEPPDFVSVEDCRFGPDYLCTLADAGYDLFALLDQSTVPDLIEPETGQPFPAGASGPFGHALPVAWQDFRTICEIYHTTVRTRCGARLAPRSRWWDIHAARSPALPRDHGAHHIPRKRESG